MKTAILAGLVMLSMFIGPSAFGVKPYVGMRAYSSAPHDIVQEGRPQKREVGIGIVAHTHRDGRIAFHSEQFGLVEISAGNATSLEPLVDCSIAPGALFYSQTLYDVAVGAMEWEKREVGIASVKEVFGNCRTGRALIVPSAEEAPGMVSMASLLPEVRCPFSGKYVYSNRAGSGVVKEVYGDCKSGRAFFRADRDIATTIIVPASSIILPPKPSK